MWNLVSAVLGLAIGAGLNLYAAVLVTGLGIRYGWVRGLPGELEVLGHPVVLIAAGVMYLLEFLADKVPFVTPIWDGIHTFVRPVGGALLALGATAELDPVVRALAVIGAGTLALGTHTSKMGFRLLAHTAPEPATHSVISVAEDLGVAGLLVLAFAYPWVALPVFVLIILGILAFVPVLVRVGRFLVAGLVGRVVGPRVGGGQVRVFARRVPGAPRLVVGWVDVESGVFRYRRWGVVREARVGALEPGVEWGFVYDIGRTGAGASFYLTKEWGEGWVKRSQ